MGDSERFCEHCRGGLIILGLNEAEGFVPSANFAIDRVRDPVCFGYRRRRLSGSGDPCATVRA